MKKTLVALAALAATSAFAQNSVTLYGTLDLGAHSVEYLKNGDSQVKRRGYATSGSDTARWGITGKEDLGGGMAAEFKVESQIGTLPRAGLGGTGITTGGAAAPTDYTYTNGTAEKGNGYTLDGTVIGNREIWLAATKGTTRVQAGYGVTALRNLAVQTDPGTNNYGNLIAHVVGGIRRDGLFVTQSFGPIVASGGVFGQNQTSNVADTGVGDLRVGKGYTYNLQYTQGPINAGFGYDQARSTQPSGALIAKVGTGFALTANPTAADVTVKTTLLAGSYDAGVAKLYGQVFQQENVNEGGAAADSAYNGKWTGNTLGAKVPFGAFTPYVQIYNGKNKQYIAQGTAEDRKVKGQSFGVRYDLSKRTAAYVNTGYIRTDKGAGAGADELKFKQTGAGLIHNF